MTPAVSARVPLRRWSIAVFAVFVLLGFSWGTWLSRFPAIRDELGFTLAQMSLVALSPAAGSLVGLFTAGRTVNALGTRRSLLIWMTVMAVGLPVSIAILVGVSIPLGLALFFAYGFAFGTADVAINVNGTVVERRLGRSRMSLFHAGFSIGSVSALGTGALIEHLSIGIVIHLGVVSALFWALALVAFPFLKPEELPISDRGARPAHDRSNRKGLRQGPRERRYTPWRNLTIVLLGVVALSGALAEGVAGDWLPLAFVDEYGLGNDSGVLVLSLFYGGAVISRLFGDNLVSRIGRAGALRLTLGVGIIGVALVVFSQVTWLAVIGALLWGVGSALTFPIPISAAADNPATATRDVATVSAIGYSAFVMGPVAFGLLGDAFGLRAAFLVLVVILAVGWTFSSRARPRPADPNGVFSDDS